jgi:hypothetical protein
MGDNTDANVVAVSTALAAQVSPYVILPFLVQILLEFITLVFGGDWFVMFR